MNLNETTHNYLSLIYAGELPVVIQTLEILDAYNIDLNLAIENIAFNNNLTPDLKVDAVNGLLYSTSKELLIFFGVTFGEQRDLTQEELMKILVGLKQLEESEDHVLLRYHQAVEALEDPKELFISILTDLDKTLDELNLMEGIEEVDTVFIERVRLITTINLEIEQCVHKDPEVTLAFIGFLGEQECLGRELYEKGYTTLPTFLDLIKILPFRLEDYFRTDLNEGYRAKVALDFLSLCMISSDGQDSPLLMFEECKDFLGFSDGQDLSEEETSGSLIRENALKSTLANMYADFNNFYEELCRYKAQQNME